MTGPKNSREKLPVVYWFPAVYRTGPNRQCQLTAELSRARQVFFLAEDVAPGGQRSAVDVSCGMAGVTVLTVRQGRWLVRLVRRAPLLAGLYRGGLVRRALRRLDVRNYVLMLGGPTRWLLPPLMNSSLALDYIDPPFAESERHARNLARIVRAASLVTATAAVLEDEVRRVGGRPIRLPNASSVSIVPRNYSAHRRLRVGYLGTIDDRVDVELIRALASADPSIDFVVAGRVNETRRGEIDRASKTFSNLIILGPLDEQAGEAFLDELDIGFVPFKQGPMGDAINATKYYHYAAHGLPIVASNTREARELAPFVTVASGVEESLDKLRNIARGPAVAKRQREFAAANTWAHRAEHLDSLLVRHCDHGPDRLRLVDRWTL